jgi:hypothetical protein
MREEQRHPTYTSAAHRLDDYITLCATIHEQLVGDQPSLLQDLLEVASKHWAAAQDQSEVERFYLTKLAVLDRCIAWLSAAGHDARAALFERSFTMFMLGQTQQAQQEPLAQLIDIIDGAVILSMNLTPEPETMLDIEGDVLEAMRLEQPLEVICLTCDLPPHQLIRAHHNAVRAFIRSVRGDL